MPAIGNVRQPTEAADESSPGIPFGAGREQHVEPSAILGNQLVRGLTHVLTGEQGRPVLLGMPARAVRRHENTEWAAQDLLAAITEESKPSVAHLAHRSIRAKRMQWQRCATVKSAE